MFKFTVTDGSNVTEFEAVTVTEGIETLKEFHTLPYYQQERLGEQGVDRAMASGWYVAAEPKPVKPTTPPIDPEAQVKKASKKKSKE